MTDKIGSNWAIALLIGWLFVSGRAVICDKIMDTSPIVLLFLYGTTVISAEIVPYSDLKSIHGAMDPSAEPQAI
jgi:hypothetical protein